MESHEWSGQGIYIFWDALQKLSLLLSCLHFFLQSLKFYGQPNSQQDVNYDRKLYIDRSNPKYLFSTTRTSFLGVNLTKVSSTGANKIKKKKIYQIIVCQLKSEFRHFNLRLDLRSWTQPFKRPYKLYKIDTKPCCF